MVSDLKIEIRDTIKKKKLNLGHIATQNKMS